MDRKKRLNQKFDSIAKDIKSIKIQGARNVAKAALKAYSLFPDEKHKKILLSLRPTEPMLFNVLDLVDKAPMERIFGHFDYAQQKINKNVLKIIKNTS